jgi:hypothetical protein
MRLKIKRFTYAVKADHVTVPDSEAGFGGMFGAGSAIDGRVNLSSRRPGIAGGFYSIKILFGGFKK